jgi:opacity protein-like surface antigen
MLSTVRKETMKKVLVLCVAAACFCLSSGQAKAADQLGVYVAPKFVYGFTMMDKLKGTIMNEDSAGSKSGAKDDSAWGGAVAIGYDFYKRFQVPVRAELEYAAFSKVEGKISESEGTMYYAGFKQKMDIQTLFVNAYFDLKTGWYVNPYVGAGVGVAFIEAKGKLDLVDNEDADDPFSLALSTGSKSNSNFAWNVGAGLGWEPLDWLTVDLGYRFVGLGTVKTATGTYQPDPGIPVFLQTKGKVTDLYMHQVALGFRFTF